MQRLSRAIIGGVDLFALLALAGLLANVAESSTSATSSDLITSPEYPSCKGEPQYIADAYCDPANNNELCGYDGGDCCECTCSNSQSYACGEVGFDCRDPSAPDELFACENVSIDPPATLPCALNATPRSFIVEDTEGAAEVAAATLCSGGEFEVEWKGHVATNTTIYIVNGTRLSIVGDAGAVMNGSGTTQMLSATEGTLEVSNVHMTLGRGAHGGAIIAVAQSTVRLVDVDFSFNTARQYGGAIYAKTSFVNINGSSVFSDNGATYGGALHLDNRSTFAAEGEVTFIRNNASTDGGALYAVGRSEVHWSGIGRFVSPVPWFESGNATSYGSSSSSSGSATYIVSSNSSSFAEDASSNSSAISESDMTSSVGTATSFNSSFTSSDYGRWTTYILYNDDLFGPDSESTALSFLHNSAEGSGGAIAVDEGAEIFLTGDLTVEGNTGEYGGAIFIGYGCRVLTKGNMSVAHNEAAIDGGAIASAESNGDGDWSTLNMGGPAAFVNNTCRRNGGAISASSALIVEYLGLGSSFTRNVAGSLGGALYLIGGDIGIVANNARFAFNSAQSGGAVFTSGCGISRTWTSRGEVILYPSTFAWCTFVGNTAKGTGGAIESSAGRDLLTHSTFERNEAATGGALRLSGMAELTNSSFVDNVSGEGGGSAVSNAGVISTLFGLNFSGNSFRCATGWFADVVEDTGRFDDVCSGCDIPCEQCVVEDEDFSPVCTAVFEHSTSRGAATLETILVEPGYWRATRTSRVVLECFNQDACLGGLTGGVGYCSEGYRGPYCSVCTEGHTMTLAFRCSKCSKGNLAVASILLGLALAILQMFLWHMIAVESDDGRWRTIDRMKALLPLQSVKIIIVAWQIITQFSSVANVIYPDTYQQFLDVVAVVNFDLGWILSAGCIMRVDFHDGLLLATIGPLIASALLGVTYKIASHRNRSSEQAMRKVRRKHIGAIILMTFLVYSSVSSAVFRAFACDDLEDGYSYLRTDYRILCDSPRHKAFQVYAGLMIAVYPLGIPLLYGILLFRKRKVLLTNGTVKRRDGDPRGIEQYSQQSTSSLWKPYQPEVYYYEVVECGRRIMLTGVVVFIYPNTAAQISMTLAVAFMFVVISETLRPYASRWDAWVSRTGHVIVFLSMYVALLLRVDASNESQQAQDIFAGILVAAHATMILVVFIEAFALVYSLRRKEDDLSSCSTRTEKIAPTGPNDYSDDGRSEADLESKDEHKYASDKDDAVV